MNSSEFWFVTALLMAAWPSNVVAQPNLLSQLSNPANTWVKRTPLPSTPVSPRLGYEDACVWTYDLASNTWRNMCPLPAPHVAPLRCASWDSDEQVVVVFGGEGGPRETLTYNPHRNEWRWMKPKLQPEPRSGGQMAYDAAHKVHVMFGSQFTNDPHTWIYDLRKNEWSAELVAIRRRGHDASAPSRRQRRPARGGRAHRRHPVLHCARRRIA